MSIGDTELALRRVRLALIGLGALLALLAVSGVLAHEVFRQPTLLKYAVSVSAALAVVVLAMVRRPLRILVPAIIVLAPFGALTSTFSGVKVSLEAVLIAAAILVAVIDSPLVGRLSYMGVAGLLVALLLAEPIAAGTHVSSNVLWLGAILATAWLVSLVAREPGGPIL